MSNNKGLLAPGSKPVTKATKKQQENNGKNKGSSDYFNHQLNINENELKTAARFIKDRADMNSDIIKLVPEIKQIRNITLSSLVSPNDFSKKELIPNFNNILGFSETFTSKMKSIINTAVSRYDLVNSLFSIGDECLFNSGADVLLVMPRSMVESVIQDSKINIDASTSLGKSFDLESISLDKFKLSSTGKVNVDTEKKISINKKLTYSKTNIDLECSLSDYGIEYNGNPSVVTINSIRNDVIDSTLENQYYNIGVDKESIELKTLSIYDKYKKNVIKQSISIGDIDNVIKPDRKELPFTMQLRSSATMPLYVDSVDNHVGYIVLTDEMFGNISNIPKEADLVDSLMTFNTTSKDNVISSMLAKAGDNLEIAKDAPMILSNMLEITESILLQTVQNAVNDSSYKSKMELNEENSLVRIMLYRALNNMKTRMIFIPKQYISYIAFDYRDNGTGKSLLEDVTLLASFKAMLTLSEIYAAINKNIPVTEIKATIDDDDPEPMKTKEIMEQDIYTSGSRRMIYGETSIEKHINWVSNSRFRITWVHKTFPKNDIEGETKNKDNNYTVDTDTGDRVMKAIIKAIGLVPSALEDAESADFASVEMLKNALFNKVNTERQDCLSEGVSDRLRKLMLSDSVMIDAIYDLIDSSSSTILSSINSTLEEGEAKLETLDSGTKLQILKDCISNLSVRLPVSENNTDVDNLKTKFTDYKESIDSIFEGISTSSYLDDVVAELGITKDNVLANLTLHLLLKWCEEHNYASGISNFMNTRDKKYLKQVIAAINNKDENLIELAKAVSNNKTKVLSKIKTPEEDDTPPVDVVDNNTNDTTEGIDKGDDSSSSKTTEEENVWDDSSKDTEE